MFGKKLLLCSVLVIGAAWVYYAAFVPFPSPPPIHDGWWGEGEKKEDNPEITPFKIKVANATLDDLQRRLRNTRPLQPLVDDHTFEYGFSGHYMPKVLEYWKTKYNWREWERRLNSFPQYRTQIEGIQVHFLHVKPPGGRRGHPMLILHGWPGSVFEFYKLIPMLVDPERHGGRAEDAFEVVVPSIPGFGFSEAPHRTGFGQPAAAGLFVKLMLRLGHERFYTQGGDWGAIITRVMAQSFPRHIIGHHTNMPIVPLGTPRMIFNIILGAYAPVWAGLRKEEQDKMYPFFEKYLGSLIKELGYNHIQSTKPDTIGHGLTDSPAGLAGYVLEKFSWIHGDNPRAEDGNLLQRFTMDELLTNVMVYWLSGNIGSTARFYKESFRTELMKWLNLPVTDVPVGISSFFQDVIYTPEAWVRDVYTRICFSRLHLQGGHFAALEKPQVLAADIRDFLHAVEGLQT